MTDEINVVDSDRELLALARSVLADEGYVIEQVDGEVALLLGENAYFLVGVSATPTIAQLLLAEPLAQSAISHRLVSSDPGPKRWDAYMILMTQERSPENPKTTRDLFDINYDTSGLRRIAHTGVQATLAGVRNALTPFVAPIELDDPSIGRDPFDAMVEALAARGVERDLGSRATTAFKQGVPLGDVL
jgi:hypothetical protein